MKRRPAADLVGTICRWCRREIVAAELDVERDGYYHQAGTGGRHFVWFDAGASRWRQRRVQKAPAIAGVDARADRLRVSTTGARPLPRRGRPEAFIAALVVARAAELYERHRRWSDVLRELETSGNGRYPRNTLIRRVAKYSASQKPAQVRRPRAAAGARARVAKNPRAGRRRRRG